MIKTYAVQPRQHSNLVQSVKLKTCNIVGPMSWIEW